MSRWRVFTLCIMVWSLSLSRRVGFERLMRFNKKKTSFFHSLLSRRYFQWRIYPKISHICLQSNKNFDTIYLLVTPKKESINPAEVQYYEKGTQHSCSGLGLMETEPWIVMRRSHSCFVSFPSQPPSTATEKNWTDRRVTFYGGLLTLEVVCLWLKKYIQRILPFQSYESYHDIFIKLLDYKFLILNKTRVLFSFY